MFKIKNKILQSAATQDRSESTAQSLHTPLSPNSSGKLTAKPSLKLETQSKENI
jgi:hypothetical protein